MNSVKTLTLSLFVALGMHVVMTWPLVASLTEGIPSSAHNIEKHHTRAMLHGDHLQLLYFFWLGGDMIRGETPPFLDVYQFNTGSDADREQIRTYFAPFSFFYLAGQILGGRAFGINLAGFMATWLILCFTWGLCRRYTTNPWIALAAALAGTTTSYRWATLMNGSPTGYALTWIPAVWWGLDCAIRDKSWRGSIFAGLAFLCLASGDIQAFFFCVLGTPIFCAFSYFSDPGREQLGINSLGRLALRMMPPAVCAGLGFLYIKSLTAGISQSGFKDGRSLAEVALYSPMLSGLWSHSRLGSSNDIYLGFVIPGILLAGIAGLIIHLIRHRPVAVRDMILFLLACTGLGFIITLALGTNGPGDALALRAVRAVVPSYEMIRQTGKVYSLMPTAIGLSMVFASAFLLRGIHTPATRRTLVSLAALLILIDAKSQVQTTICLLDTTQGAYEAVAQDADTRQIQPHAMAVPLWPGDSAWSSLYQHYATLYRIRMINGYHPVIPARYAEEIFSGFSSVNRGTLNDAQLDELRTRGIDYLLFHENACPDKVSPFPAGATLDNLLNHPRLRLLKQDGPVWAFRIETAPTQDAVHPGTATDGWYFPARRWEAEQAARAIGGVRTDPDSHQGGYAALSEGDAISFRSTAVSPADGLRVLLRLRGSGALQVQTQFRSGTASTNQLDVKSDTWVWQASPLDVKSASRISLHLQAVSGTVDIDTLCLTAGKDLQAQPGETIFLPASAFFRAGYTQLETQRVVLRKDYEPDHPLFNGPHLPLPAGRYQVTFQFNTTAPEGTNLGLFSLHPDGPFRPVFITAGRSANASWTQKDNLPLRFEFQYSREADMVIEGLALTRLE